MPNRLGSQRAVGWLLLLLLLLLQQQGSAQLVRRKLSAQPQRMCVQLIAVLTTTAGASRHQAL
jgi:hypothetical protein